MASKTMRLVLLTMLAILVVFVVAAVAEALGIRVPYVSEVLAALTGNSGIGAARNAYVDAPIRREQASQSNALATPTNDATAPTPRPF